MTLLHWRLCLFILLVIVSTSEIQAKIYPRKPGISRYLKNANSHKKRTGLATIDQIYVINLDFRKEKWERVKSILHSQGVNPTRFSAIVGSKLNSFDKEKLSGSYPIRMSSGEYGCLLSHISVIRDAYYRGYHRIWICEDDIDVIEEINLLPQLLQELNDINPSWDVFYTDIDTKDADGNHVPSVDGDFRPDKAYQDKSYYNERIAITDDIMKIHQRFGLYSYILSRSGMKKILSYFSHMNLWCPIDIDIHYVPDIQQYSARKDLITIWHLSPISDIHRSKRPVNP